MATPSTTAALFQIIDDYIALVSPIAARDPAAFWANDFSAAGAVTRMRTFVTRFGDSTAISIINNELSGGVARLNRIFGTVLSAPQFQAPVIAPEVIQQTFFPSPTPAQVAQFGTGVEFSALDPALVEAAAILAPESEAALFVAQEPVLVPASDPPPLVTTPGFPTLRDESTIAPLEPSFVQAPFISSSEEFAESVVPKAETFQELTLGVPGPTPGSLLEPEVTTMPFHVLDPFISSEGTKLPTSGGPNIFESGGFFDLGDVIKTGVDIVSGDINLKDLLDRLLQGDTNGVVPTTDQTFLPQPANDRDLEQRIIDILKKFPAFSGLGGVGRIADVVKDALQPSNGKLPTGSGLKTINGCVFPESVLSPTTALVHRAPPGYVIVDCAGIKVAMLKEVAIKMGKFKRRPKPPISASDWKALRTADRVKKKAKTIAGVAGFSCATKGSRRRAVSRK